MEIKIDKEFKNLIPKISYSEFLGLQESIKKEGCRDPLITWNNLYLDGHNRYDICNAHKIPFKTEEIELESREDAKIWIIKNQFARRNLRTYQRGILVLKLEPLIKEQSKKRMSQGGEGVAILPHLKGKTRDIIAREAGIKSGRTIDKIKEIEEKATHEQKEKLNRGEATISEVINEIKKERKEKEIQKQKEQIKKLAPLKEKYDLIAIDPPWNYGREYDPKGSRVASPYPEMDFDELKKIQLPAEEDSILLLWTTHQFIWEANELMKEWGFEYKAILVWDEEKMGMGSWFRMQCEFCLLGIKGKPLWDATDIRDIIKEPRTAHSVKPEGFYKMAETICVGKKLDYFNNGRRRKGWDNY